MLAGIRRRRRGDGLVAFAAETWSVWRDRIQRLDLALSVNEDNGRPATDKPDELERLHRIGRMLGIDHAVDALKAGVPVEGMLG